MSTVSFRSLSAPTMRSAVLIWPTRISTLVKSSMPIWADAAGAAGAAAPAPEGAAGAAAGACAGVGLSSSFAMASILSIASVFSTRGNSVCALPSAAPGTSWPQRRPSSAKAPGEPDWPSSDQIFRSDCFSFFHTRKQCLCLAKRGARNELAPTQAVERKSAGRTGLAEQRPDFRCAVRQDRISKRRDDAEKLRDGPQDRAFAALIGFGSAESSGLFAGEIFVGSGDDRPDGFEHAGEIQFVVILQDITNGIPGFAGEGFVLRLMRAGLRDLAGEVLLDEGGSAAGEIAEAVGEVAVIAGDERVVAEVAVLAEDDFAQQEIAQRVHAKHVDDGSRQDDVALGLAHFGGVHQEPAVRPNLLGNGQHGSHEERGPIDGVETDDVLSH